MDKVGKVGRPAAFPTTVPYGEPDHAARSLTITVNGTNERTEPLSDPVIDVTTVEHYQQAVEVIAELLAVIDDEPRLDCCEVEWSSSGRVHSEVCPTVRGWRMVDGLATSYDVTAAHLQQMAEGPSVPVEAP